MLLLTRSVRFSAAHRYHRPGWSEERNQQVFGACASPHGHGHNYILEATVGGVVDPETGYSTDLGALDEVLKEEVVEKMDHQHLNHAIPDFAPGAKVPTTENILIYLWDRIAPRVVHGRLLRLRLREDVDLHVDYFGPDQAPGAEPFPTPVQV